MNAPEKLDESAVNRQKADLGGENIRKSNFSAPSRVLIVFLVWTFGIDLMLSLLLPNPQMLSWPFAFLHVAILMIALAPVYYLSLYLPLRYYVRTSRHATQTLQETLDKVQKIVDSAFDGIIVINEQGHIEAFNAAAEKIFGQPAAAVLGKNISTLMPEPYRSQHDAFLARYASTGKTKIIGEGRELKALRNGTEVFPIELHVTETDTQSGRRFVGTIRDISRRKRDEAELKLANEKLEERVASRTAELEQVNATLNKEIAERKRIEARLHEFATTDALTGALNRREFDRLLINEYEKLKRHGTPLSIILFDVDRFKQVNDRYGHLVGDKVLVELAQLLKTTLRRSDIFARWGGEEFVILAHGNAQQIYCLAEKIRTLIAAHVFPEVGYLTCSFGVAEFSDKAAMMNTIGTADKLLYAAKANGRNRTEVESDESCLLAS